MKNTLLVLVAAFFCVGYPTSSTGSSRYIKVGCFKDKVIHRALPELLSSDRGNIQWTTPLDLSYFVEKCAKEAKKKKYIYFSVQFYAECWSGENAPLTYDRYGSSSCCTEHVGKAGTNMVYRFKGYEQECGIYSKLNTENRAASFQSSTTGSSCDKGLPSGWYRFLPPAGNQMASYCVPTKRCGTLVTGWLSSPHPKMTDGIVSRTVCFNWKNHCCRFSQNIQVRNCGRFFVYKLAATKSCPMRFCAETKSICS